MTQDLFAAMRDYMEDLPHWEVHCQPELEDMVREAIAKEGWVRLTVVVSPLVPPGQVIMFDARFRKIEPVHPLIYPLPQEGI